MTVVNLKLSRDHGNVEKEHFIGTGGSRWLLVL